MFPEKSASRQLLKNIDAKCKKQKCIANISWLKCANIFLLLSLANNLCTGQFFAHINHQGLKGNVTFDIREDQDNKQNNGSILEIEALIEADQARWIQGERNEEEFDSSQAIYFEWSLYSNTLEPYQLSKCSIGDLGAHASEPLLKSLPEAQRLIQLDLLNRWSLAINKTARELSSLIWGKSIRLKLAKMHETKSGLDGSQSTSSHSHSRPSAATSGDNVKATSSIARPPISRPQFAYQPTSPAPQRKPTFAPRPKPSISSRLKSTNATVVPRNKREMATSEGNTTASIAPATRSLRDAITLATNRRILKLYGKTLICANVIDNRSVKTVQADFEGTQVGGRVTIRGNEDDVTLLSVSLYHIRSKDTTLHDWKLMASDILDTRRDEEKCEYLSLVFDPLSSANSLEQEGRACASTNGTGKCQVGELGKRHGQVQVAGQGRSSRQQLVDMSLPLSALEGSRPLFVVLFQPVAGGIGPSNGLPASRANILSCALLSSVRARKLEANFNMDGVRGSIKFSQRHASEPTSIAYDLFGLEGNVRHVLVHELPVPVRSRLDWDNKRLCSQLGKTFQGQLGNLSSRHQQLTAIDSDYEDHYVGEMIDLKLQLFGHQTLAGRSVSVQKNNGDPWVCATLDFADEPMVYATVNFHYPVVGKMSFSQQAGNPREPTGVLVELYNPNNDKEISENHNWLVHEKPAMSDFYNWSQRCESSGDVFDPMLSSVSLNNDAYSRQCLSGLPNEPLRCRLGDTSLKSNMKLTLPRSPSDRLRFYYTDPYLPLSGPNSILGRSVVIYDDYAPVQRGKRLACSTIKSVHALRASVRSWDSGPSIPSNVRGSVQFEQDFVDKATRTSMDLSGFNGNIEQFGIHQVWLMDDREFPCSNDSLYDIYDPFGIKQSSHDRPSAHYGSSTTADRVKVGDLSSKYGSLEGLQSVQRRFKDNNLSLFAPNSILRRSVVFRAAVNDFRWVCGTIEFDYDKSEAREIVAMASFDEPRSKVAGFVKFFQLEHNDGSLSDTFIQVDLRLQSASSKFHSTLGSEISAFPLSSNKQQAGEDYNWAIFVNQVGEDAFIAADEVRCIAAGFKWNPYLAQDTLETYSAAACTPTEPEGCAMGDLGMRHGALKLGAADGRRTLSDSNLPLVGNYSIMARSLVVFDSKRPNVKLACANIIPDIHLKSNVVIKQTPSFTVARFIEQMRSLLEATEWLMVPELRATKLVANGECVQMTIHFYGQRAHQMQIELNNLITLGTVRRSTRTGVDKITTHYRMCRAGSSQLTTSGARRLSIVSLSYINMIPLLVTILSGLWIRRIAIN